MNAENYPTTGEAKLSRPPCKRSGRRVCLHGLARTKERGNELKGRVVGRGRELRDQAIERGSELKDQATAAAEVAREAVSRTPADRCAKLAGAGLMLIAFTVLVRKVLIR